MPPLTVMIKPVSSACNMRCRYCFYTDVAHNRQQASLGRMSDETLEHVVRKAMRYADGYVSFVFQGGEPSLAGAAFYETFLSYQRKYNTRNLPVQNAIQTNGYQLDESLLDLLAREHFLVGVSFDGTPQLHDRLRVDADDRGTSAAVEATIQRLEERGVEFDILCVVNCHVARHPRETFQYLKKYRYLQYIACLDDLDGTPSPHSLTAEDYTTFLKESFDLYYQAFRQGRPVSIRNFDNYLVILMGGQPENCAMSGRCAQYYLIEADGGVYPCDFYVLDHLRMGNIREDSFFKLEKSPVAAAFRSASLHSDPACQSCRWFTLCRGGCRRDREPALGNQAGLNKWCSCYQALFEYAYPRMMEMAQAISTSGWR